LQLLSWLYCNCRYSFHLDCIPINNRMELQSLICMDILVMFYCTNVQFYPSIFNVSLNLCTSVQKYMYKMYIPLYKQCIIRLFCNVYQCTIISYCNCVPVYDHLFLHLPLCTSVPNNVPVYEMQMCTSVQFCKHKDKCTSVH
jgi:hypothetical protein